MLQFGPQSCCLLHVPFNKDNISCFYDNKIASLSKRICSHCFRWHKVARMMTSKHGSYLRLRTSTLQSKRQKCGFNFLVWFSEYKTSDVFYVMHKMKNCMCITSFKPEPWWETIEIFKSLDSRRNDHALFFRLVTNKWRWWKKNDPKCEKLD